MATVDELISSARTYVSSLTDSADDAISEMKSDIDNIGFTVTTFTGVPLPPDPTEPAALVAPSLDTINLELPEEPGEAPIYQDISDVELGTAPQLTATLPTLTLPVLPAALAEFTDTVPEIETDFEFPEPPSELDSALPIAPVINDRTEPAAPTLTIPAFEAVQPVDESVAPSDLAGQFNDAYRDIYPTFVSTIEGYMDSMLTKINPQFHDQMTAIETQLSRYLAGGTGLNQTVEDAIYERASDKITADYLRTRETAIDTAAKMGHTMPGGAALAAIRAARQAAADNHSRAAIDIAIKQAEMEQENLKWSVTTSQSLRQAMLSAALSYHGNLVSINAQALDYAKTTVGFVVELYNIQVRAYTVRLEGYKTEAQVYETRMRAAQLSIEVYRSEIQALEALVSVDKAKVDVYRARMDALQTLAGVYRARVDAVVQQANLEKLQLELFQSKTQAYSTLVQAKRAEFDGYQAAIQGQESLVRLYSAQVQTYSTEVQAWKAKIDGQAEAARAQAANNRARSDLYEAELRSFSTLVNARKDVVTTRLENERQKVTIFDAEIRAYVANVNKALSYYQTKVNTILKRYETDANLTMKAADQNIQRSKAVAEVGTASARVYQGLASAGLTSLNTLVAQTQAQ